MAKNVIYDGTQELIGPNGWFFVPYTSYPDVDDAFATALIDSNPYLFHLAGGEAIPPPVDETEYVTVVYDGTVQVLIAGGLSCDPEGEYSVSAAYAAILTGTGLLHVKEE